MSLTCKDVMLADQPILHPNDSVSKAFKLMRRHGVRYLPVVDEEGTYLGVFTSPTLIKLLLPRAVTINLGGKGTDKGLHNLGFFNIDEEDFQHQLEELRDELVQDYLSDPKNIPVTSPKTSIMEGILLLNKYKRHVILVKPKTQKFVGVVTINSVLQQLFNEPTH